MADLPRPTYEEIAKALEEKVNDQEVELQLMNAVKVTLEVQLTEANNEVEQLRAALRTSEQARLQAEEALTEAHTLFATMVY
jgi:sensor histidine kinase YesM